MSFDPNVPQENTDLDAAQVRAQLNALKALIDNLPGGTSVGMVPVGGLVAWLKSFPNAPALPVQFAECHGQVLSDVESPFNGATLPDLNGASGPPRFLRGAAVSGGMGGAEEHIHSVQALDQDHGAGTYVSNSTTDVNVVQVGNYNTDPASSLPSYYEVVWVMRIK